MNERWPTFWTAVAMTGRALLMTGLVVVGLFVLDTTGLARVVYAVVGVVNVVAATVSALVVRQRVTGRDDGDESIARFGSQICILTGVVVPNTVSTPDARTERSRRRHRPVADGRAFFDNRNIFWPVSQPPG